METEGRWKILGLQQKRQGHINVFANQVFTIEGDKTLRPVASVADFICESGRIEV